MRAGVPSVTLELPSLLTAVAGRHRFDLTGRTIREALEAAFAEAPALRHHLLQDSGELRPHILCILNDACLPRRDVMTTELRDGDGILIHQAISGG